MKNIVKYIGAFVIGVSLFSACQELEDFNTTIDAVPPLAYVTGGADNVYTTKITHTPIGSIGEFNTKFPVRFNTSVHGSCTANFAIDNDLISAYNSKSGKSYSALPDGYIQLDNASIFVEENVQISADSVCLALVGDFSFLTEKNGYLVPVRMTTSEIGSGADFSVIYLVVNTEKSSVRPVGSVDDMVGFPVVDRTAWTADIADYARLFDNGANTYVTMPSQYNSVLNVDLGKSTLLTGLCVRHYSAGGAPSITIEYSENGNDFEQAGTPTNAEYIDVDAVTYIAFYGNIKARYVRLIVDFSRSSSSYRRLYDLNFYALESDAPTIYAACGNNNVLSSVISHTPVGSFGGDAAAFNVRCTHPVQSGYSVNVAVDNSYVSAYNAANKTEYAVLPDGHIAFENNPVSIGALLYKSTDEVKVKLTGDLTGLKAAKGYLVPLKLSASGAATSTQKGVVYLVITWDQNNFRANPVQADVKGTLVSDRTAWTGDAASSPYLFDGNVDTNTAASATTVTVNLGSVKSVDAFRIFCRYATSGDGNGYISLETKFEVSTDGVTFVPMGMADMNYQFKIDGYQTFVLYQATSMQYVRLTCVKSGRFYGFSEFDVYAN